MLREQPALAGPVASDPVVLPAGQHAGGRTVRGAEGDPGRAGGRAGAAWALAGDAAPGAAAALVIIDLDATIVIAHSEKEQASATWKEDLRSSTR
jgi:hypothetical protein